MYTYLIILMLVLVQTWSIQIPRPYSLTNCLFFDFQLYQSTSSSCFIQLIKFWPSAKKLFISLLVYLCWSFFLSLYLLVFLSGSFYLDLIFFLSYIPSFPFSFSIFFFFCYSFFLFFFCYLFFLCHIPRGVQGVGDAAPFLEEFKQSYLLFLVFVMAQNCR